MALALVPVSHPITEATACGGGISADMHISRHPGAFNDATCLLTSPCMEDCPQGLPKGAIQALSSPLGHTHHVILAIPPSRPQALIGVRHGVLLRCALIKPPEEHSTAGPLKAVQVSLVKPVAYLKNRVNPLSTKRCRICTGDTGNALTHPLRLACSTRRFSNIFTQSLTRRDEICPPEGGQMNLTHGKSK
jgi:hypothetical protein